MIGVIRLIPAWLALLLLQVTAFLFQLFCAKYFEVGLLIPWLVLAPFWPGILVNFSALLIIKDVWQRRLAKPFLMIPAIWFGGYAAATIISHDKADRIQKDLESFNQGKLVRREATALPIQIDDSDSGRRGQDSVSYDLIRSYGLSEVFSRTVEFRRGEKGWSSTHRIWLARQSCPAVPENIAAGAGQQGPNQWTQVTYQSGKEHWQTSLLSGLCMWSGPADPKQSPLLIHLGHTTTILENLRTFPIVKGFRQNIQITHPDGKATEIATGAVTPLTWLPLPFWGCGFHYSSNEQRLGETCRFDFWAGGEISRSEARDRPATVIARALGLIEISLSDRFPKSKTNM